MTIWKYPLQIGDFNSVQMPKGATILSVDNQNGILCLWAMVDPEKSLVTRKIRIVGTGHTFDGYAEHIGSVVMAPFVWHVFEV